MFLTLKTLGYWGQGLSPLLVSGGWGKISNVVIDFAPWRILVPIQSFPVSPPPMTKIYFSC